MEQLLALLEQMRAKNARSVQLVPFAEPRIRTMDGWVPLIHTVMDQQAVQGLLFSTLTEVQRETLQRDGVIVGSVGLPQGYNLNFHIYRHKLGFSGLLKEIEVLNQKDKYAGTPPIIFDEALKLKGLMLITGPVWSGKSTLLAQLIQRINQEKYCHIGVRETAVEFLYRSQMSIISQFEQGVAETSDADWLALQKMDVIALDVAMTPQLIERALDLVESGKQVIMAAQVDSLPNFMLKVQQMYAADQRDFVRDRLANALSLIVNQRLIMGTHQHLVPIQEIIIFNENIRNLLRKNATAEIAQFIQEHGEKLGMRTLNQALIQQNVRKKIDLKAAYSAATHPESLNELLDKLDF